MSEREPRSPLPDRRQAEPTSPAWDLAALAQALNAPPEPEPVEDIAFGAGHRVRFGDEQRTRLEVYPAAGVITLARADLTISFKTPTAPEISPTNEVIVERPGLYLAVGAGGSITLLIAPQTPTPAPPQSPPEAVSGSEGLGIQGGENKTAVGAPGPAEPAPASHLAVGDTIPSPQPSPPPANSSEGYVARPTQAPPPAAESEQKRRVTLTGRVARVPWFRETPRQKKPIAGFPLAVKMTDDTTTYHDIVAFDARAERLKDLDLQPGQVVQVVGYVNLVQKRTRDGVTLVEEIRAAVVKRPGEKGQPKPPAG